MAVMTPARARTEADYTALTPALQAVIDRAMEDADHASTAKDYADAMEYAALAAGLPLPADPDVALDLAVCDCLHHGCGCGLIFDTRLPGVVVTATNDPDHNLSRLQCPTCGHDHGRPLTD